MGGLLLVPRPAETQTPMAAPTPGVPSAVTTVPSPAPEADLSPKIAGADHGPAVAPTSTDPDRDTATDSAADGDAVATAPDAAALLGLPEELGLGQLVPSPDRAAPSPAGITPAAQDEEAAGEDGPAPGGAGPLVAGMLVSLAVLTGGGGWLWWRNRDSQYFPA